MNNKIAIDRKRGTPPETCKKVASVLVFYRDRVMVSFYRLITKWLRKFNRLVRTNCNKDSSHYKENDWYVRKATK